MAFVRFYDLIAAIVAIGLLLGIFALLALGRAIPDLIANAFLVAIGWVFRGGTQTLNDIQHARRLEHHDGP